MESQSNIRPRPPYMVIFIDLLKRHEDSQPKFTPTSGSSGAVSGGPSDKPSLIFSNVSNRSMTNPLTGATTTRTFNSRSSLHLRPHSTQQLSSRASVQSQDSQALSFVNRKGAGGSSVSPNFHPASEHFNQRSPPMPMSDNGNSSAGSSQQQQAVTQRPQALLITSPNSPAVRPSLVASGTRTAPALKNLAQRVMAKRDSGTTAISQTPTGKLGTTTSLPGEKRPSTRVSGHYTAKDGKNKRHTSLAKTILEHTPTAFRTVGMSTKTAAEDKIAKATEGANGGTLGSTMEPSDYEHIYHMPSQTSDIADREPIAPRTTQHGHPTMKHRHRKRSSKDRAHKHHNEKKGHHHTNKHGKK